MTFSPKSHHVATFHEGALAHGQGALWFVQQLAPSSSAYNVPLVAWTPGLDGPAMVAAWQDLIGRHGTLRTTYPQVDGRPRRRVHQGLELDAQILDLRGASSAELQQQVEEAVQEPFDLQRGPVARLRLWCAADGWVMAFMTHHIGIDFASVGLLLEELELAYGARLAGRAPAWPTTQGSTPVGRPTADFDDFVDWQHRLLDGPEGEAQLAFWRRTLAGAPASMQLPTDRPPPLAPTFAGGVAPLQVGPELGRALKDLARSRGVDLAVLLLAAFQALLHRYSDQRDLLIGCPQPGRAGHGGLGDVVGYFVNPVVVRGEPAPGLPFGDLLAATDSAWRAAVANQDYPFPLLVERLQPPREGSRSPFFQALFVLYQGDEERVARLLGGNAAGGLELGQLRLEGYPLSGRAAMLDLSLMMGEVDDRLSASFQYSSDLFDPETALQLAADYEALLRAVVAEPTALLRDLPASLGEAAAANADEVDVAPVEIETVDPEARERLEQRAGRRLDLARRRRQRRRR